MMHQVEVREWDHEYGDQGDNDDGGQHDPSTSGELGRASGELVDRERRTERRGACELSQLFLNPLHGNPSRPPSAAVALGTERVGKRHEDYIAAVSTHVGTDDVRCL
jgi:hypothetical protein